MRENSVAKGQGDACKGGGGKGEQLKPQMDHTNHTSLFKSSRKCMLTHSWGRSGDFHYSKDKMLFTSQRGHFYHSWYWWFQAVETLGSRGSICLLSASLGSWEEGRLVWAAASVQELNPEFSASVHLGGKGHPLSLWGQLGKSLKN